MCYSENTSSGNNQSSCPDGTLLHYLSCIYICLYSVSEDPIITFKNKLNTMLQCILDSEVN